MNKIVRISRLLRYCFEIASVMYLFYLIMDIAFWIHAPESFHFGNSIAMELGPRSSHIHPSYALTTTEKIVGFLTSLPTLLLGFYSVRLLAGLFKAFSQQQIFSLKNTKRMYKIGFALLLAKILIAPTDMFESWLYSYRSAEDKITMAFNYTGDDIFIMLMAGLLIVVSWILAEAWRLQEEQKYTV